ncbi:transglycosylase domain-containing protein [Patescibacteria group bacterium]
MAKRKFYRKLYRKKTKRKKVGFLLKLLLFCFLFFVSCLLLLFIYYAKDLPRPEKFTERPYIQSTKIYDRNGEQVLYELYGEEKRTVVPLNAMSEHLKEAVIVAEDQNFYNHFGLDLKAIVRALLADFRLWQPAQGASTIPQQLIRSSFLTLEKTAKRKVREIILTLELSRRYSKDQILEWYLNQIPFGSNAYGVEAASKTFFNKSAKDLSVAEAATLTSLIQAPSYLSPFGNHIDELLARKNYILDKMEKFGYLTKEEVESAKGEELKFSQVLTPIKAPHFVFYVREYLLLKYGEDFLQKNGLKVYTSLDWELQELAEGAVKEGAKTNEAYSAFNASLVALDPNNGEILAMVGSKDWSASPYPEGCTSGTNCLFDSKVNVSTFKIGRQPGSAFKPLAYATAFKKGYTPDTVLWDAKTEFNTNCSESATQEKDKYGLLCYHPENYDGKFRGPITLREALAQSINVPSVKTLYLAGIKDTIETAESLGITTLNGDYGLSLVLGGGEVKLLDIVSAYGVFANEGFRVPPVAILKIEDSKGNIIEENKKTQKRVLETQVCRIINDILSDNKARTPMFGPRSTLYFEDYQVAAKTGTTQDFRDAWTVGYTPFITVGVWVGNNNNSPMAKKPGVILAGPIWRSFMEKVLLKNEKKDFEKPDLIQAEKPVLNGEIDSENPHSILNYLDKNNPNGELPENFSNDSQYEAWEEGLRIWLLKNKI